MRTSYVIKPEKSEKMYVCVCTRTCVLCVHDLTKLFNLAQIFGNQIPTDCEERGKCWFSADPLLSLHFQSCSIIPATGDKKRGTSFSENVSFDCQTKPED